MNGSSPFADHACNGLSYLHPETATDLLRASRALKAGEAILYRTESDDQGAWLTDIDPPLQ